MFRPYRRVKDYVFTNPLLLSTITDPKLIKIANNMMPRSVGIEIECNFASHIHGSATHERIFESIPNIMHVNNDDSEQRYRLPPGIEGMIVLYRVCDLLKEHSTMNLESGIHYHIDITEEYNKVERFTYRNGFRSLYWMLARVKHWNYEGNYNSQEVSFSKNAIKLHSTYRTFEFRTGEMTFEYELMMRRIISAQSIVKKVIAQVKGNSLKSPKKRTKLH